MDAFFSTYDPVLLGLALLVAVLAGTLKGMVGFGMPLVLISGLGTFLAPEWALAGLILPTVASNGLQAFRHGWREAWGSVLKFRRFLVFLGIGLLIGAQFVRVLPPDVFLLLIGLPVTVFAGLQLIGFRFQLDRPVFWVDLIIGGIAGLVGGISGTWGPPTVIYLTALGTEKAEQIRVQGVIYGVGAILLLTAHIGSGVFRAETAPFSLALVPPAMLGMWVGGRLHDRIDQATFRKATLIVLTLAGLNLVRRGLMG